MQKRFLSGAFADGVDESGLCIARGNGKTTFCAAIAHAVLDGPLSMPRAEVVILASSFSQGKIAGNHVLSMIDLSDRKKWRKWDSATNFQIMNRYTGVTLRCLGSDPKRAHGIAPSLILCDEPAQWPHTTADAMFSALQTALGKIPGSRLIALGTRPEDDTNWFSELLDHDADFALNFQAHEDLPPFQRTTWAKSNPSLKYMPSLLKRIKKESLKAKRDPRRMASFRSLRLNQGTADTVKKYLMDADEWKNAEVDGEIEKAGAYVLGLDLGSTKAMSAACAFFYETGGGLDAVAVFPENPSLKERGIADGVGRLYERMAADRGELIISGVHTCNIGGLLKECLDRWGRPVAIVCDRWREGDLREALSETSFPLSSIITRGQGWKDGSEDVRIFSKAVSDGFVKPSISLLLRSAISVARLKTDPAGNSKLAKSNEGGRRFRARDDAAAACILAVAEGMRRKKRNRSKGKRRFVMVG